MEHTEPERADPERADPERADPDPATPVVVTGLMGAGKTTLASALAARWGRVLHDSDADLLASSGRTAAQLAGDLGADGLHDLEARHLLDALAVRPAAVVAGAASVVESPAVRAALRGGRAVVVRLDADPAELVAHQPEGGHRPRYGPDLRAMLGAMDARRRPLFERVADVAVRLQPVDPAADDAARAAGAARLVDDVAARVGMIGRTR